MRKLLCLAVAVCLGVVGVGAGGCGTATLESGVLSAGAAPREGRAGSYVDSEPVMATNQFGFALLETLAAEGENTVISPLSVAAALSMTHAGAEELTAEEMSQVLGVDQMEPEKVSSTWADLLASLMTEDDSTTLRIANSLWIDEGAPVEQEFIDHNADYFGAEMRTIDMQEPGAPDTLNAWVDEHTEGLIPEIVQEFDPYDRVHLVNAIYFLGDWAEPFDERATHDEAFTLANGEEIDVPMMNSRDSWAYAEDGDVQIVQLPYEGWRYSALVVVPKRESVWEVLEGVDSEWLAEAREAMTDQEGSVALPRFEIEWGEGMSLIPALGEMGMPTAFSGDAEFGGISRELQDAAGLYISQVSHRTYIKVDESGTEAAAVTDVGVAESFMAAPPIDEPFELRADKPFVFTIMDNATGSMLFLGVIADPR